MFRKFIDDELQEIIEDIVHSFIGWEVILLFNDNPNLKIKEAQLAQTINRSCEDLEETLSHFHKKNIVQDIDGYVCYKPDKELKAKIDIFIEALNDRNKRLAIISQLLEK